MGKQNQSKLELLSRRGEGENSRTFYVEKLPPPPPPRSKPLPCYIPFLTEKVTLPYTFHRECYPFHKPTVEELHRQPKRDIVLLPQVWSFRDILKGAFIIFNFYNPS